MHDFPYFTDVHLISVSFSHFQMKLQGHTVSPRVVSRCAWLLSASSLTSADLWLCHPTDRNIWKVTEIKKGKGYVVCACTSGTSGHVPFHRLSWTLPSTWTLRPFSSSSETADVCLLSYLHVICLWMKRQTCKSLFLSVIQSFKVLILRNNFTFGQIYSFAFLSSVRRLIKVSCLYSKYEASASSWLA